MADTPITDPRRVMVYETEAEAEARKQREADTPTTEVDARALNDAWRGWLHEVDRIRSEAVAAERARIERGIRALDIDSMCHDYEGRCGCGDPPMINRAAVLAILDPEVDHG